MKPLVLSDGFIGIELDYREAIGTFKHTSKDVWILLENERPLKVTDINMLHFAEAEGKRFFIHN